MEINNKCKMSAVSKIMAARQKNAGTWGVNANIVKNHSCLICIHIYTLLNVSSRAIVNHQAPHINFWHPVVLKSYTCRSKVSKK